MGTYDYIKDDLAGYPYNSKYPPNYEQNGGLYHGYKNNSEETFFYDFAVQRYDLRFSYKGVEYYFLSEQDNSTAINAHQYAISLIVSSWGCISVRAMKVTDVAVYISIGNSTACFPTCRGHIS